MNLHEYQAKILFESYGIPVPAGLPAHSISEALEQAAAQKGKGWVIKAQVHAGGRGKAGGVKLANTMEEVERITTEMLGKHLVTHQSAPQGQPVSCVLVQEKTDIARELYLGLILDRSRRQLAVMASTEGGMDIEAVAANTPDKLLTVHIDTMLGLQAHQCRRIGFALGLDERQRKQLQSILQALYRLYLDKDLSLVEINPLIINSEGDLMALDAKINIDDNALFRQLEIANWHDPTQDDEKENIARRFDLNYVALDGDIGCMVNGAGLAMATMDIIKLHGGNPANFLDVGGGTTADKVREAFKLIVSTPGIKAILVNIFGGIVRCDLIAEGVIQAVRDVGIEVPVVVRLAGTRVEEGKQLLADSGLSIVSAEDINDAARQVVALAEEG